MSCTPTAFFFPAALASLAAVAALTAGCGGNKAVPDTYGTSQIAQDVDRLLLEPYSDTQALDVIYATNRVSTGDPSDCGDGAYGTEPTGKTSMGVCRVNVPKRHHVGGWELASTPHDDPHRYFRVLSHAPLDET